MEEKGVSSIVVIAIVVVIAAATIGGYFLLKGREEGGLTSHYPIYINRNSGFTAANGVVAGSGTAGDPFIIENWAINASSANGIDIENTTAYFIIRNCLVENGGAIYLENVANGKIENNIAENNRGGITLYYSENNLISNNIVRNIEFWGVDLYYSENNLISGNTMENNYRGIYIWDWSNNNIIFNNTCENNFEGIYLSFSDNNLIYHNNIANYFKYQTTNQATDIGSNQWDNGYPSGGNYWSDYTGADENHGENQSTPGSDGIGDTPYNILGGNNQDRYPLMKPFGEAPSGESNLPLIAGVIGVIVVIGIAETVYMRRR